MKNESLVKISGISKRFGKELPLALDNIDAEIFKGQIVGLAGPDGAGKTTLLRLIACLLNPTEGSITVAGYDTVKMPEEVHLITGYMPQKFGLYEDLTIQENLNLYADLTGIVGQERKDAFERLLELTSLTPFTKRLAGRLSGGMKQKLGLACTLLRKPTLLLLDEPSVGVDPLSRRQLMGMVQGMLKEGLTVIWSTAYLDEAERCDSVLLLNEGKLLYKGPPHELTDTLQERVFKVSGIQGKRRSFLMNIQRKPEIIDCVVEAHDIHFVTKTSMLPQEISFDMIEENQLQVDRAPPRFEDAFIDLLGGGPKGPSLLAEKMSEILTKRDDVIKAENLTKQYGTFTAVNQVSFSVKTGEVFGLLGPNGAGKSTTFKMLCGLVKPTIGNAYIDGLDLQVASGEARSHIGYMAQKFSLYGNLSVKQNLYFFSGIYNLHGKQQKEAVDEMIQVFNLKQYLNESADGLPLGYKQRLALSCSLMHKPSILFLDEPTAGVDPITRREFWSHINGLVNKNITVVVTTHFMDEAEFCDRIALVYQGKMIEMGTPEMLKAKAATKENPHPTLEETFIFLING